MYKIDWTNIFYTAAYQRLSKIIILVKDYNSATVKIFFNFGSIPYSEKLLFDLSGLLISLYVETTRFESILFYYFILFYLFIIYIYIYTYIYIYIYILYSVV